RPFGSALIIGGVNGEEVKLFETDPSGALIEYKATAIGSGVQAAMDVFEERYEDDISLEDAISLGLDALYEATEGRTTAQSVEIAVIEVDTQSYRKLADDEVSEYVEALLERNAEEEEEESEEEAEEVVEEEADETAEAEASEETSEDVVDENVTEESDGEKDSEE
ncbi:MAG: proteasome subunit alpha, partial [Methanobrevibacter sp.]|nr:proteasome subunit alpha [Methanobrevibacter sp.]